MPKTRKRERNYLRWKMLKKNGYWYDPKVSTYMGTWIRWEDYIINNLINTDKK